MRACYIDSAMPFIAYLLGGIPGALLALAAATGLVSERAALLLFAPSFIGLNLAHMASAWSHAYAPGWRQFSVERALIPLTIVLFCLGLEALGFGALLLSLQYWLSIHHAAMQNYGILRSTQPERGRRIDQAACLLLPLGALAYRAHAVTDRYDGVIVPRTPIWLGIGLSIAGAIALIAFAIRQRKNLLGVAFIVTTNLIWCALLVGISHPALPLYALASGHYIHQLYFVHRHQKREGVVVWLGALLAVSGIVVVALTLATLGARALLHSSSEIPPWLAAMIGINLWHYWIESRIWRRASAAVSPA
jgi:hypothetical protein